MGGSGNLASSKWFSCTGRPEAHNSGSMGWGVIWYSLGHKSHDHSLLADEGLPESASYPYSHMSYSPDLLSLYPLTDSSWLLTRLNHGYESETGKQSVSLLLKTAFPYNGQLSQGADLTVGPLPVVWYLPNPRMHLHRGIPYLNNFGLGLFFYCKFFTLKTNNAEIQRIEKGLLVIPQRPLL